MFHFCVSNPTVFQISNPILTQMRRQRSTGDIQSSKHPHIGSIRSSGSQNSCMTSQSGHSGADHEGSNTSFLVEVTSIKVLTPSYQRGGLMDKTLGLSAGRSGVRIPGRGKCSLRTIAVDARVNYPLYLLTFKINFLHDFQGAWRP